ncbi:MAG: rRNA maturation RNase YbeY [Acidimicrobiales bacterium]|nr:rRNA maturation RNase YbeY [Acidimicrobiales bacterium]
MTDEGPVVVAVDEQSDIAIDLPRWQSLSRDALVSCGVDTGELNLLFVDETEMTALNRDHMGEDRPTDVLSFPLDAGAGEAPAGEVLPGEILLGDIVVCPAYAARQAGDHAGERGHRGTTEDELALLIVHGVLHVLGHDHAAPDETVAMQAEEQRLLDRHHRTGRRA